MKDFSKKLLLYKSLGWLSAVQVFFHCLQLICGVVFKGCAALPEKEKPRAFLYPRKLTACCDA